VNAHTTAPFRPRRRRPMSMARVARDDRGASTLEAAILAPVLLMLIAVAVISMRIEVAAQAVESAAHDAARAASISRTQTEADTAARNAADDALSQQDLTCTRGPTVVPDTSQFQRPIGETAVVTVTVTCVVPLDDVGLPGLPGTKTLTATFTSYLDQFRGRS
jgi:Flp pilus assembly protein TadG